MITYSDGAYNLASGTRAAFGALSDDLVAEGLPPMTSRSGDREPEDQLRIWYERMTLTPGNRRVYGTKRWQGRIWFQIHPDSVGIPDTSNHEKRRANDLRAPYNSDTAAHRRAQVLARNHSITCEGMGFREWWHWTYWGPLGTIGAPASAGGSTTAPPVPEEDEDMRLIAWNGRAWVVSDEKVAYVRNDRESLQMAKLLTKQSAATEITNAQLTELLFILAIPWAALDATFKSQAFDNESNWGKGTIWSRQIAEGHEDALRDASLARNLYDLARSVKAS